MGGVLHSKKKVVGDKIGSMVKIFEINTDRYDFQQKLMP